MRTLWSTLLVLMVAASSASAQPGASQPDPYPPPPPQPYPPQPQPYPQPQPQPYAQPPQGYQVPPPYAYQPQQVQLTPDEAELLQQGEISDGQHIGGGVAALFFGFGIGQGIQGRWSETGWIFTLGEGASIAAVIAGAAQQVDCFDSQSSCSNQGDGLLVAGLLGYLVFRSWDIVDAFVGPSKHNNRVRELRMRLGMPQPMYGKRITPYLNKHDGTGVAGVTIRF